MKQMKADLKAHDRIDTFFAVRSSDLRKARDGRNYLAMNLADRSGQISGYVWDNPEEAADHLRDAMYVYVQGMAKTHNSGLIMSIEYIRPAAEEEIDVNDFLDVVPGGVDIWMDRLHDHIGLIKDANCRALVCAFLDDHNFLEDFKISPAGMIIHHSYVGGLLEHTVNTMSHAVHMSEKYPALLDRDMLLTGAFLHDIGKLKEMTRGIVTRYTTEGKLLGHILMGLLMMEEKICLMKEFPAELGLLLKHMIFSHHGNMEFGSPVRPATPEALALHHIENLDAKMNHLYCFLKDSPDNIWSNYDKFLSTEICRMRFKKELCAERQLEETLTGGR